MRATDKELKERIENGERAFRRVAPLKSRACKRPRFKLINEIVHINGNVIEYDRVVEY